MPFTLPRMMPRFGVIEDIDRRASPWSVTFDSDAEFTVTYAKLGGIGVAAMSPLLGLPMSRGG